MIPFICPFSSRKNKRYLLSVWYHPWQLATSSRSDSKQGNFLLLRGIQSFNLVFSVGAVYKTMSIKKDCSKFANRNPSWHLGDELECWPWARAGHPTSGLHLTESLVAEWEQISEAGFQNVVEILPESWRLQISSPSFSLSCFTDTHSDLFSNHTDGTSPQWENSLRLHFFNVQESLHYVLTEPCLSSEDWCRMSVSEEMELIKSNILIIHSAYSIRTTTEF